MNSLHTKGTTAGHMTVGRLVFGLVATLVIVIWGCVLRDVLSQYATLRAIQAQQFSNDAADDLLAAARDLVIEQVQTSRGLTAEKPVSDETLAHIRTHRHDGDIALQTGMAGLDSVGDLVAAHEDLKRLRLLADRDLTLPLTQRDPDLRERWQTASRTVLRQMATSVRDATLPSDRLVVAVRRMNRVKLWSLQLRQVVEEETTPLTLAASRGQGLTVAELIALTRLRTEAEAIWHNIQAEAVSLSNAPLMAMVEDVQHTLNDSLRPLQDRIMTGTPDSGGAAATAEQYADAATATMDHLGALMDLARREAATQAESATAAATRTMVVHALLALAALGFGGATLALLRRRLLTPLHGLREDLRRLARRDLDLSPRDPLRHDELGEMHAAILEFRDVLEERRSLWNALPDFICFKDATGRWQWINAAAATLFGLEEEDYRDKTDADVAAVAPNLSPWLLSAASAEETVRSRGATISREEVIATAEGDVHFFHVLRAPLFRTDHVCRGTIVLGREVTDRRRTEVAMARLAQQNQLLLDCAGEGIIGLDTRGHVTFVNPAVERLTGWDALDLVGQSQHQLMHHHHLDGSAYPEADCPIHHTLVDGQTRYYEREIFWCKSGAHLPVEFTVTAIVEQGEVRGAVIIFRDIHARLTAEQEIESLLTELRRSNAELERFAYVASHDLRQPLRMITSYLSLIVRRMGDRLGPDEKEFLDFAVDGAQRMDRMILDLLAYSRIGRTDDKEPVALAEVLESALATLQTATTEAGAEISVPTDLPVVSGVRSELERLFQNLLSNALKFRAESRPPRIAVACRDHGDSWEISVADNGIGIDPKDHDRLFNIFQRLVSQTQYDGTGIGLASCRKIAEHHGGRIWVTSSPGEGSTFFVSLPKGAAVAE